MRSVIYCRMENPGQAVCRLQVPFSDPCPEVGDVCVEGPFKEDPVRVYLKETRGTAPGDICDVSLEDGLLNVTVVPFTNRSDFTLIAGNHSFPKDSFDDVVTEGLDRFAAFTEGEVVYRLYSPEATEARPLILFLHGGGNGGQRDSRDNEKQLTADYGPVNFSMIYPENYILAPQAIESPISPMAFGVRSQSFFKESDPNFGWSRSYLMKVCDIIRRMVREGKVDEKRIYVTGLSMGGAGTLRAMSVASDLFAACAPVCPTMTQDTFNILRSMKAPVWVSSAYVDHTVYRHKYLTDAIIELKDSGHKNAHLTLYSPEELAAYDIGIMPETPYPMLFSQNHASWVLTYHNEHGIMSWLLNQHKD